MQWHLHAHANRRKVKIDSSYSKIKRRESCTLLVRSLYCWLHPFFGSNSIIYFTSIDFWSSLFQLKPWMFHNGNAWIWCCNHKFYIYGRWYVLNTRRSNKMQHRHLTSAWNITSFNNIKCSWCGYLTIYWEICDVHFLPFESNVYILCH